MKKILILLLLLFTLVGCQANRNADGLVSVRVGIINDEDIYYFDENNYIWYDNSFLPLNENGYYYIYTEIEEIPFYELANKNEVMIYGTGRNSYEIFVKASDIHTIKIEV